MRKILLRPNSIQRVDTHVAPTASFWVCTSILLFVPVFWILFNSEIRWTPSHLVQKPFTLYAYYGWLCLHPESDMSKMHPVSETCVLIECFNISFPNDTHRRFKSKANLIIDYVAGTAGSRVLVAFSAEWGGIKSILTQSEYDQEATIELSEYNREAKPCPNSNTRIGNSCTSSHPRFTDKLDPGLRGLSAHRAQRTKFRDPKGLQLEVGARRGPLDFYPKQSISTTTQ